VVDGLKSVGFSHRQFCLQIEALNSATRECAFRNEPIEYQSLVTTEHFRHFLHGFEAGTHGARTPSVEKVARNVDIGECTEPLETLPEKVGPNRCQVQIEKLGKTDSLLLCQVPRSLQKGPSAVFKKVFFSRRLELGDLRALDKIDRFSELLHNVEAVEDIQCLWSFLRDDLQIRMPHIAADEAKLGGALLSEHPEESEKSLDLPLRAAPEKPPEARHRAGRPWSGNDGL